MVSMIEAVRLNQYAQGIRPLEEATAWFAALALEQKRSFVRELAAMIGQAHPTPEDVLAAVERSGLKPTYTPSVLMTRGPFKVQAAKVAALPEQEQDRAFVLFLALLGISDRRRRDEDCAQGCSHWWHRDLSDELTVRRILEDSSV
jgi:hypothetical protein